MSSYLSFVPPSLTHTHTNSNRSFFNSSHLRRHRSNHSSSSHLSRSPTHSSHFFGEVGGQVGVAYFANMFCSVTRRCFGHWYIWERELNPSVKVLVSFFTNIFFLVVFGMGEICQLLNSNKKNNNNNNWYYREQQNKEGHFAEVCWMRAARNCF